MFSSISSLFLLWRGDQKSIAKLDGGHAWPDFLLPGFATGAVIEGKESIYYVNVGL